MIVTVVDSTVVSEYSYFSFTAFEKSSAKLAQTEGGKKLVVRQKLMAQTGFTIPMYLSVVLQPLNRVLHSGSCDRS